MKRVRRPKGLKAIMRTALLYDNVNDDENRLRIMNYDKTREACTMTLTITKTYIIYYLTNYKFTI